MVADLGTAALGTFMAVIASAPYQIQILIAGDGAIPAEIVDWGSPLKRAVGDAPGAVTVAISQPTRYVLVLLQAARQDGCVHPKPVPRRDLGDELRRHLTTAAAVVSPPSQHSSTTTSWSTAAQGGDRGALDQLLRRHYDRVHAVCRRITGNDADAADAAQEAMIAIVRNLDRFDGRSSFGTWAYRIATNASLDELRRRKRRRLSDVG